MDMDSSEVDAVIDTETVKRVQYGDFDYVKNLLSSSSLTSATIDRLWLLHWAAVNNRVRIAELLIEHGANVNFPAGELNEIPLQWAVRTNKFTYMVYLLLEKRSDLLHKNINGHDALSIACIFGNIDLCFVLLHNGASPHSVDNEGNSALHCTIHCNYDSGIETQRNIVRLLLNFGADPTTETFAEKNTALHKLLLTAGSAEMDLFTAYYLCEYKALSGNATTYGTDPSIARLLSAKNSEGLTAFDIAKINRNMFNIRFFFDYYFHRCLPRCFVTIVFALLTWMIYFALLYTKSYMYATVICSIVWASLGDAITLKSILKDSSRRPNGWAWGIILTIVYSYWVNIAAHMPNAINNLIWFLALNISLSLYLAAYYPPELLGCSKHIDRILWRILKTGIVEGPTALNKASSIDSRGNRDETELSSLLAKDDLDCAENGMSSIEMSKFGIKSSSLIGDTFNNGLHCGVVNAGELEFKLCTACLTDKSLASTHCPRCDACVVMLDHHCEFIDNCVGVGNRRIFVWFTFSASFGCGIASLCHIYTVYMNYIQAFHPVMDSLRDNVFAWGASILYGSPVLVYSSALAMFSAVWIGALFCGQIQLIAAETTTFEVMRGFHDGLYQRCHPKSFWNVVTFLKTGKYSVVRPARCKGGVKVFSTMAEAQGSNDSLGGSKLQVV